MTDVTADAFTGPNGHDHAHDADHKPAFFARRFMSTNHKDIGTLYLIFAIITGMIRGVISGLMRLELAAPGMKYQPEWAGRPAGAYHRQHVIINAHCRLTFFFMVMTSLYTSFS